MTKRIVCVGLCVLAALFSGCAKRPARQEVIVYTSLDKVFSQPIFEAFEKETGIKVKAVYDSEATKTTGLVNRLIAEKNNPKADIFWNSETGRTVVLMKKGVLAQYVSPCASDIPAGFKDPEGYWTGFAARCRILIYNTSGEILGHHTNLLWKSAIDYQLFTPLSAAGSGRLSEQV